MAVKGKMRISYMVFNNAWVAIIVIMDPKGNVPAKAREINNKESADSPAMVDRIARNPKCFPWLIIFIRLIIKAFRNEPTRYEAILAKTILGVDPSIFA
jgi:hypothetical protein